MKRTLITQKKTPIIHAISGAGGGGGGGGGTRRAMGSNLFNRCLAQAPN